MDENRKVWQKPELIVLVRSKPEEAVLGSCKRATSTWGSVPGAAYAQCQTPEYCSGYCYTNTPS